MKAENREAPADAAAPDIVNQGEKVMRRTVVREGNL